MQFATYKVPNRGFNICFLSDDYQGDALVSFAVVFMHRGFKLEHWFWNRKLPNFDLRLFKR